MDQTTHAAMNFPMTRIAARYQHVYGVPAHDVARHERELKRYLILRSRHHAATLPTPTVVDRLWHVFLLYTRDYTEFCDILGGFIHHVPTESAHAAEEMTERYREMLDQYEELFRESPPTDVWPTLAAAARFSDCDAAIEAI